MLAKMDKALSPAKSSGRKTGRIFPTKKKTADGDYNTYQVEVRSQIMLQAVSAVRLGNVKKNMCEVDRIRRN